MDGLRGPAIVACFIQTSEWAVPVRFHRKENWVVRVGNSGAPSHPY